MGPMNKRVEFIDNHECLEGPFKNGSIFVKLTEHDITSIINPEAFLC